MDHILIINRIGRTLMTITTRSSVQSFEIAPGPITTSVRKGPYEYDAHPFTYSKEALGGRLEIWDCTGRLVYSWQRNYPAASAQQLHRPYVGLRTPSQTPRNAAEVKTESGASDLQVIAVESVQQMQPFIAPGTPQTPNSHADVNPASASRGGRVKQGKRKRGDAGVPEARNKKKVVSRQNRKRDATYIGNTDSEDAQSTEVESDNEQEPSAAGEDSDSLDGFIVDEEGVSDDESNDSFANEDAAEESDVAPPRKRGLRIMNKRAPANPQPITPRQKAGLIKVLTWVQKTARGKHFKSPVDPVKLNIPDYYKIIKKPMDLETMKEKLARDLYLSIFACTADFEQIVQNSVAFNGEDHEITECARFMKRRFDEEVCHYLTLRR